MNEMKIFDQKMYDSIKEDFKRGRQSEKIMKLFVMLFLCVVIFFAAYNIFVYFMPSAFYKAPEFEVTEAYYENDKISSYMGPIFIMKVEVSGDAAEEDYNIFLENVLTEYKDEYKDAYLIQAEFITNVSSTKREYYTDQ